MKFQDALYELSQGNKVRYQTWGSGIYLEKDSVFELWLVVNYGSDYFHYSPRMHELEGEWEIFTDSELASNQVSEHLETILIKAKHETT